MKITLSTQLLTQDIEDELILLNMETGRYFGLQGTGNRVWQLLAALGDTDQVLAALQDEYDADETTLRQDIDELIERLIEANLVSLCEEPA